MNENCKRCKVCDELKNVAEFYLRDGSGTSTRNTCKGCERERHQLYRKTLNGKLSEANRGRKYRNSAGGKEVMRKKAKRKTLRGRELLSDSYIKKILKENGIKPEREKVELKRIQLKLKRKIYELQRTVDTR